METGGRDEGRRRERERKRERRGERGEKGERERKGGGAIAHVNFLFTLSAVNQRPASSLAAGSGRAPPNVMTRVVTLYTPYYNNT